jgi:hypothetical protein
MPKGERMTSQEEHRKALTAGDLSGYNQKIYEWLKLYDKEEGWTRNEIAEYARIRLSTVCGRVHTLILSGLIEEIGEKKDRFTDAISNALRVVDREKPLVRQENLFEQEQGRLPGTEGEG